MRDLPPVGSPQSSVRISHVLVIAFALRLLLPLGVLAFTGDTSVFREPDSHSYIEAARGLTATGTFSIGGVPEVERTPGYPLLLLPGVVVGSVDAVTIALQIVLGCLTVYLVYRIALLLFRSERAAVFGALLYALEPLSILYSSKLLTETLFTAVTTLFLFLLLKYLAGGSLLYLPASGAALAASVYVRPVMYYFPLVMTALLLVWVLVKRRAVWRGLGAVLAFLAVTMALVGVWQVRNSLAADYPGFSAIADVNWYFYQGASVLAEEQGLEYTAMQERMGYNEPDTYFSQHPEQRAWSRGEVYEYLGKEGRKIVLSNLPAYGVIHLKGTLVGLLSPGGTGYLEMFNLSARDQGVGDVAAREGAAGLAANLALPAVFLLFGIVLAVYFLLAGWGLLARKELYAPVWPLLALAIYLPFISGGPQAESRFRHPIMPVICVLGGYGLVVLLGRIKSRVQSPESKVSTLNS
jgi:4-amino-4-deoxy-L-arabinose transferase-like glycosyltransferase